MLGELAYLNWLMGEELTRQQNVMIARNYYAGEHDINLTDRQREFLGVKSGGRFAANYCATVVNAVVERLEIAGLLSPDDQVADWAWGVWRANRMDGLQGDVHQAAVRDGEAFVMVSFASGLQASAQDDRAMGLDAGPRLTFHQRYCSPQAEGDGFGCKAFYPNDDYRLPMSYATKRWSEEYTDETRTNTDGRSRTRQRLTVYYPARVEKYVLDYNAQNSQAGWAPYADEDAGVWPLPWVDRQGRPLGIPVIHFKNPDLESELWDAIPLQDGINKAILDLMAAMDTAGIPIWFARGFYATSDGNPPNSDGDNYLTLAPGQIIGTTAENAGFERIPPPDLTPMLETFWSLVQTLAQVTDTPQSRFQLTRQVSSAEAQKAGEGPLLAKVANRQTRFGAAWVDALTLARRLQNAFGTVQIDEEAGISVEWAPPPRDEKEHIETLALKREKLGIPLVQVWREAGYDQEEIDEMMTSEEYQARTAMMRMGLAAQGPETDEADDEDGSARGNA